MQLLIVEDDLVTGALLKKVLSKEGYEVSHKTNGSEALKALQSSTFRIIITDWIMPGMDGPTLCRHIRELELPQYLYIILLTAKDSKKDAVTGLESGADDYIIKPFDNHELLARIRAGRRLVELEDSNRDTQNKLARSEKLAVVGHLAAGVAHEINNPIGFISSNLSSLNSYLQEMRSIIACYREMAQKLHLSISEQKLHTSLPSLLKQSMALEEKYDIDFVLDDANDLVGDCKDGTQRIKAIVHEMHFFAHPEVQTIESYSLEEIVKKVAAQFDTQLPANVSLEIKVDNLPEIPCNAPHIEQAMANLLRNAIDATSDGGQITIHGYQETDRALIQIEDNGRGIPKADISKVFDPFFTTKPIGQGIGLGLTTALNIIRMHNGSIAVTSKEGDTTTFTVDLPVSDSITPS
jgi:signal transduction histidine kinase